MVDEWDLCDTNLKRISERDYKVAVLPVGATEAHNYHLPQGIDSRHAAYVARRCCSAAWQREPTIVCLPTLPYGVDCNLLGFPISIHVSQANLDGVVRDIITSLAKHGIRRTVILNGHGGNEFMPLVRQLQSDSGVYVFVCNWWQVGQDKYGEIFDEADDHGGEMETSVALAICQESVEMKQAGSGQTRPFALEALRRGWVRTSRDFSRATFDCAVGDPSKATANKGALYLDLVCERVTEFLVDLARADDDELFPHAH